MGKGDEVEQARGDLAAAADAELSGEHVPAREAGRIWNSGERSAGRGPGKQASRPATDRTATGDTLPNGSETGHEGAPIWYLTATDTGKLFGWRPDHPVDLRGRQCPRNLLRHERTVTHPGKTPSPRFDDPLLAALVTKSSAAMKNNPVRQCALKKVGRPR